MLLICFSKETDNLRKLPWLAATCRVPSDQGSYYKAHIIHLKIKPIFLGLCKLFGTYVVPHRKELYKAVIPTFVSMMFIRMEFTAAPLKG